MPNPDPGQSPSTSSPVMNEYALLGLLLVGCVALGLFIMARMKRTPTAAGTVPLPGEPIGDRRGSPPSPREGAAPAVPSSSQKPPALAMPSPAASSKQARQPAGGLSMPERPREVAAFFSPEDSAAGTGPGGAGVPQTSVESVVHGRKMYVIDVTGWGVAPPQGFAQEDGTHGTWNPASGDKSASRILVRSGPACAPSCAGQPVSDSSVTRSVTGYRRSYSFRCPWVVKYGGADWKYADVCIIKLDGEACVTMTLLSKTPQGRDEATPAFLRMRDSIQPLPQKTEQPTLDGKVEDAQVPLLR